jgi:dual specificity tyrosine-phosphorylation-regulated kinase 2/3/4
MGVGKRRHNSVDIDTSSVYSGWDSSCTLYKGRTTGSLAASAEALEGDHVPPVPLPLKDLSIYRPLHNLRTTLPFPPLEWMIVRLTAQSRSLQPPPMLIIFTSP